MIHAEVPITDVARAAPKPNGPLTSPSRMLNAITNTATFTGNPPYSISRTWTTSTDGHDMPCRRPYTYAICVVREPFC